MSTHRAAVLIKAGEPLEEQQVQTETLEPYEVLVRNHAIGINPIDGMMQGQGLNVRQFPHIIGFDSAGVIEAVGSDVRDRKVGQRVACFTINPLGSKVGAFQEKTVLWSACTIPIPDSLSFAEAATLPTTYATAATGLALCLDLPVFGRSSSTSTSTPVVVLGASTSVGQFALQILRGHGFKHLVASASPANFDLIKKAGATHVIDYKDQDFVKKVEEAVGGKAPVVFVAIGSQQQAADIVMPETGKVLITFMPEQGVKWPCPPPISAISFRYHDFPSTAPGKGAHPEEFALGQKANAYLAEGLANGTLVGTPVRIIDAKGKGLTAALTEGLEANKKGVSGYKIVVEL